MKKYLFVAIGLLFGAGIMTSVPALAEFDTAELQMVVVKSTDGALKEGTVINGASPLKLNRGTSVTLIGSDGSIVTLKGPYQKSPANELKGKTKDPGIVKALGALLSQRQISTAALGVVRSATPAASGQLPDPWAVSINRSGDRCIRNDFVVLWRDDATTRDTVTISLPDANLTAQADWAAGDRMLPISSKKFRDRGRYTFELGKQRVLLTLHRVPENVNGVAAQAAWMAKTGCEIQALAMLDTIR
ncbi:MAG: hypothetical protein OEY85_10250 [Rhodospirillales bacterium]|nr:hypothetical protein [Rhodospirillales bacterium]